MSSIAGLAGLLLLAGCGASGAENGTPSAAPRPKQAYVALGDSYTAAPEVGDPIGPTACERTTLNYPHLVAAKLGLDLHDVSCGGADTTDLAGRQHVGGTSVAPQLDALGADTDVVTISIGANDNDVFGSLIVNCGRLALSDPTGSPCTDGAGDVTATLARYRSDLARRLGDGLAEVMKRAPQARVLVVGYPQVVPAAGRCPELPLATGDVPYAHRVNLLLDEAARLAARAAGAEYVDIWAVTAGHDICGSDPWIAGISPTAPAAPFHPYAAEQRAVATAVEKAIGSTSQITG